MGRRGCRLLRREGHSVGRDALIPPPLETVSAERSGDRSLREATPSVMGGTSRALRDLCPLRGDLIRPLRGHLPPAGEAMTPHQSPALRESAADSFSSRRSRRQHIRPLRGHLSAMRVEAVTPHQSPALRESAADSFSSRRSRRQLIRPLRGHLSAMRGGRQ